MAKSTTAGDGQKQAKKRKASVHSDASAVLTKRPKTTSRPPKDGDHPSPSTVSSAQVSTQGATAHAVPLSATHQSILAALKTKYDILPALTISSTKINKRVTHVLSHLRKDSGDPRPAVALLHARPPEVCKMITVAEQVKRELGASEAGRGKWFQYNMMYAVPPKPKAPERIEETILAGRDDDDDDEESTEKEGGGEKQKQGEEKEVEDDDDGYFEMDTRFQDAINPKTASRPTMSLSIFLSRVSVPELKARGDVSVQSSDASATK